MSYTIPEDCPACGKCLIHCPTQAIKVKDDQFYIDPELCNFCEGYYPEPQCIIHCPSSLPSPSILKKGRSKKILDQEPGSPDLFFEGRMNHPFASAMVIWEACNLLSQQGCLTWAPKEDKTFLHSRLINAGKGEIKFWLADNLNVDEREILEGRQALDLLQSFDLRSAALHLIYAAYAATLEEPWRETFSLTDRQIEAYLGLDKRRDMSKISKLALIKTLAQQPCLLLAEINWPSQGKIPGFSAPKDCLWRLVQVQHHFQEDDNGCKHLTGLTFTLQAGSWSQYFLNRGQAKQKQAFYQYSNLPQSLLRTVMTYWQQHPGAVRIMLWLLFKTRMGEEQRLTVATLMRIAYGQDKILKAATDREERKIRIRTFENDLAVLDQYGLKPIFDEETYPFDIQPLWAKLADIPDDADEALDFWIRDGSGEHSLTDSAPRGKWNRLLNARLLGFKLPADWLRRKVKGERKKQRTRRAAPRREAGTALSGADIVLGRQNQGWSQRELAERMGKSQSWIRDIEKERFQPKQPEQQLLRQILKLDQN
ncbi:MAG: helix-turn-helix domain-containing protein [Cyanobacteria bacterium RI_101]|nr:helix-turn-helix domain-containing protein [Cyanobacteria bacterium RI_101]